MNWSGTGSSGAALLDGRGAATRAGRSWWPGHVRRRSTPRVADAAEPTAPVLHEVAAAAVSAFRSQVLGTRCGRGPDAAARVRVVLSSAAHTADPRQLEMWVLLGDVDEDRIPARWDPTQVLADVHLTSWALQLRSAAIGHLVTAKWPEAHRVVVRIDAADRVERRGGWSYLVGTPVGDHAAA